MGCDILSSADGHAYYTLHLGGSMDVRIDDVTHHVALHSFSTSPSIRNVVSHIPSPAHPSAPARISACMPVPTRAPAHPVSSTSPAPKYIEHLPGPPSRVAPSPAVLQETISGNRQEQLISLTTTVLTQHQLGDLGKLALRRGEMAAEFQHLPWN